MTLNISDLKIPFTDFKPSINTFVHNKWQMSWNGRVVRRCWVNFQCRGVLLIWIIVGQGPVALAIGAGGGCLDIFSLICPFSPLSPSLWETARYRLKYCLKGPLNPKQPKLPCLINYILSSLHLVNGNQIIE